MREIEELYNEINNAIAKCGNCEDCEFYIEKGNCQNKRIAKALIDLGYRKREVNTNGDYIRKITIYTNGGKYEYSAKLVHTVFDTYEKGISGKP